MQFHWYWPFARPEELDWAVATARPGEEILVETMDRPQAPQPGRLGPVTVVRDLPDVDRSVRPGIRWAASRARSYLDREAARRRHWRTREFDLVHLHYTNRFTDALAPLARPLVISVHDVRPHVPRLGRVDTALVRRTYRRADALVVHHDWLASTLTTDLGIDPSIVHVVPHQVFPVPAVLAPSPDEPPLVLFFGALRPNKGLDVLAEALGYLGDDDLRFVIAGRGDPQVEGLARRLAAADPRVRAEIGIATLHRKRELFAQASVVVLPYTSFASQSGVLHDAYGHHRPVVVSDVGALGETVREDGTGLVAPGSDPGALASRIRAVLEPHTWHACSRAAAAISQARSPEVVGKRLRSVYDTVLRG